MQITVALDPDGIWRVPGRSSIVFLQPGSKDFDHYKDWSEAMMRGQDDRTDHLRIDSPDGYPMLLVRVDGGSLGDGRRYITFATDGGKN